MNNEIRWSRLILVLLIFLFAAGFSFAGSQWDIALNVPYYMGLSTSSGDIGTFTDYMFLLPSVDWHYYFGTDVIHFGPGVKLWTLIVESIAYPVFSAEAYLGDFVLNGSIGGGAFLMLGAYNNIAFESLFLPEFSVAYRLGKKKRVSLGAGAIFFIAPGVSDLDAFAFAGTALARFTF